MSEWTDERISQVMLENTEFLATGNIPCISTETAYAYMRRMRDELRAENARLRAMLPRDEANMDRYCRGFNDGYEYAKEQDSQSGEPEA